MKIFFNSLPFVWSKASTSKIFLVKKITIKNPVHNLNNISIKKTTNLQVSI